MIFENMVELSVHGENTERFLNMCSYHNIKTFHIRKTDSECFLKLYATDFFQIKDIVKKSGVNIKIIQKEGIYFRLKKQAGKKIFCIAACLCLFLLWIGSHFLWGIEIEGNQTITDDLITDYLQENGIIYGMPLSQIPINELKTNLRNTYDEITWVSIYLKGTNLHIAMKENDVLVPGDSEIPSYTDLNADETGIIDSILVRQGTAMVKPGDIVKKGDVLISGKIEIPADDGTIRETRFCEAEGEVAIIYDYPIEERISFEYLTREYTGNYIEKKEIYYHNEPIPISFGNIPFVKYDSVRENINIPIFTIASLPFNIKNVIYREYLIVRKKHTNSEAEKLLKENLDKIILTLEEKGVQIIEKNVKINTNSVYLSMTGNLRLRKIVNIKQ